VFVLELNASDVHAVLGRLLDLTRVAGLKLACVTAWAEPGEYRIQARPPHRRDGLCHRT
jgi:hypothetical protein